MNLLQLSTKMPKRLKKPKRLAVIHYVERLSERVARVFRKHGFSSEMKPRRTLSSMLVHRKDKLLPHQKSEVIYV